MENTKTLAKLFLVLHITAAVVMVIIGAYGSFSQSATSPDGDKFLRLYLESGMLTFTVLMIGSKRAARPLYVSWIKIRQWQVWMLIVLSFMGVSATNVVDWSLADPGQTDTIKVVLHFFFTGLLALSATFFSWHYYRKDLESRKWALVACIIGGLGFGLSVLINKMGFAFMSIAMGELIISTAMAFVVWPVINEQLN